MDELDKAKEKFYNFFVGVAGLRFASREEFDAVVDAIVKASQVCFCLPIDENTIKIHPNCPIHGQK